MPKSRKPNILVIWGDDIGISNLSCYSHGLMGYRTPNIDRLAKEGMMFTDSYGEQSCTAGRSLVHHRPKRLSHRSVARSAFPARPSACSRQTRDDRGATQAMGYATGQFGKNHLGDLNRVSADRHGFDEFFGNLYHLNAEEEPEMYDYSAGEGLPQFPQAVRAARRHPLPGRPTRTTRPSSRAGGGSASRRSRTPARSPRSAWKRATMNSPPPPRTSSHARTRRASRSSCGSTPPTCTCTPITKPESMGQAGRWQSPYHDTMVDHDKIVGQVARLSRRARHRR